MLKARDIEKTRPSVESIKLVIAKLNSKFKPHILSKCSLFILLHSSRAEKLSNLRQVKYLVSHNGLLMHIINSFKTTRT